MAGAEKKAKGVVKKAAKGKSVGGKKGGSGTTKAKNAARKILK